MCGGVHVQLHAQYDYASFYRVDEESYGKNFYNIYKHILKLKKLNEIIWELFTFNLFLKQCLKAS